MTTTVAKPLLSRAQSELSRAQAMTLYPTRLLPGRMFEWTEYTCVALGIMPFYLKKWKPRDHAQVHADPREQVREVLAEVLRAAADGMEIPALIDALQGYSVGLHCSYFLRPLPAQGREERGDHPVFRALSNWAEDVAALLEQQGGDAIPTISTLFERQVVATIQ